MIRKGSRTPSRIIRDGRVVHLLARGSRPIYVSPEMAHAAKKAWLDENVFIVATTTIDSVAKWFELEIILPGDFTGSPEDGWTNGTIELGLIYTTDLVEREVVDWVTTPGSSVETLGDGRKKHFARCSVAIAWLETLVDFTLTCDREGKEITAMTELGASVPLTGFPYAMPADASRLETDLLALGYTGATVTSTSASLSAFIRNYISGGGHILTATFSGSDITEVADFRTPISLPSYPYSMPSQRADLQADLRTAGQEGAVVRLHDDPWTISLPDVPVTGFTRPFSLEFSPGDPNPAFNFKGDYVGDAPANTVAGESGNIRDALGDPLREEPRAFAMMRITNEATLP